MKKLIKKALSYLPTKLPTGMTEFDTWSDSIIELAGAFASSDSMKFVLADMIQRLGSSKSSKYGTMFGYVPKHHFVLGLTSAAAKQIAGQVFFDLKTKQQARQQAEATASDLSQGSSETTKETAKATSN